VLITGPLIFSSDPNMYLRNLGFRLKITMLVLALLYHYTPSFCAQRIAWIARSNVPETPRMES